MRAQDVLPDNVNEVQINGTTIRKGSIGAFLANAAAFENPAVTGDAREALLGDITEGLPALRALGLFNVFEVKNPQLRAFVEGRVMKDQPDLDTLYVPPSEMIQKAVLDHLVDFHEAYLEKATFFCLATGSGHGLDASPRGGPPGFVHVLDPHTVAFADWPGNNRIESMRNLQRDERLAMMFLFPGLEIFLRINGRGRVSTDPELLAGLSEGRRVPKTATVVQIDEVLLHCGKAITRAGLWKEGAGLDRADLPTVGQMIVALARSGGKAAEGGDAQMEQIEQINAHYDHSVRNDLY